jgi:IS5 family transposase
MDRQLSFATLDYAGKKKRTKRDVFLAEMAASVPWSVLEAVIAPHYPKEGPQGGRRAFSDSRDVAHLLLAAVVQSV